ncbi:hypothetical protein [Paenibacillus sp. GYB003]|uniref:hypothetical protein n=1 Tax=Paenibacillus sp. GYB003 TaxID=2994392 RepID=UPI002F9675DC
MIPIYCDVSSMGNFKKDLVESEEYALFYPGSTGFDDPNEFFLALVNKRYKDIKFGVHWFALRKGNSDKIEVIGKEQLDGAEVTEFWEKELSDTKTKLYLPSTESQKDLDIVNRIREQRISGEPKTSFIKIRLDKDNGRIVVIGLDQ